MDALYLIATIAGQRVAIATSAVESVVELDAITPVPRAPAHIAGLAALRSRVLTIIDSFAALDLGRAPATALYQVVVVTIDGHLYGLLVDEVEDVATVEAPPLAIRVGLPSGWARAAIGMVERPEGAVLLLDPVRLIAGTAHSAAA